MACECLVCQEGRDSGCGICEECKERYLMSEMNEREEELYEEVILNQFMIPEWYKTKLDDVSFEDIMSRTFGSLEGKVNMSKSENSKFINIVCRTYGNLEGDVGLSDKEKNVFVDLMIKSFLRF